ncbi:MAG: aldehyde dehydrogenase family protein [Clostridiales bacterium]|nr:aldehyde dehydrogenase family protein [Clostridiales bacterium]
MEAHPLLERQRAFFAAGGTRACATRTAALRALQAELTAQEPQLLAALLQDLGKSAHEARMTELLPLREELRFFLKRLPELVRPRSVRPSIAQWPARCSLQPEPKGAVLVISPWNYPLLLALHPLIEAVAAGNTVLLKPSSQAPATAQALQALLGRCFAPGHVAVLSGSRAEAEGLLDLRFDHIFFTGGPESGRQVLAAAAPHLTPVTLELGGKSPCIVDQTAHLRSAARRIVAGKFLNAGQTCIAPDYLLVHSAVRERLTVLLRQEIRAQYGPTPLDNADYASLVNRRQLERLQGLLEGVRILLGGGTDGGLRMEPTLVEVDGDGGALMEQEIFGPILPILTYEEPQQVFEHLARQPAPLALYLFTRDRDFKRRLTEEVAFGGGCVNDTLLQAVSLQLPFGGVGQSGMGRYHGAYGFETFSHLKTVVERPTWADLGLRYAPYTDGRQRLLRRIAR